MDQVGLRFLGSSKCQTVYGVLLTLEQEASIFCRRVAVCITTKGSYTPLAAKPFSICSFNDRGNILAARMLYGILADKSKSGGDEPLKPLED